MRKGFKGVFSIVTALMMLFTFAVIIPADLKVSAAADGYRFDFGNGGVAGGYIGVSASEGYNQSKGYGFSQTYNMSDASASGSGALSDAVIFKSTDKGNTFNADLNPGLYRITVFLGNATRVSIVAEDVLQLINITGNNGTDSFIIPVTDGQLNIRATEGKTGTVFSMSALEIEKISTDTTLPPTIWLCGDSTVCNYYPKDTAQRVGWGQVLDQYVNKDFMIRNLAASGQYAAGFLNAGQFDPTLKYGKPGDYYVISIGINDTNYSNEQEYYNVVTEMTKKAKEKGLTVILVKQQGRTGDITRNPLLTGRWFGGTLDKIGTEQNVKVVDLFNLAQNYFLSIGIDQTTALYDTDDTLHFNRNGAKVLAKLVSDDVHFSTEVSGTEPTQPDNPLNPPSENNGKMYGDITGDECVDLKDLLKFSLFLLHDIELPESDQQLLDFDCDGEASIADMAKMKQYIMLDKVELIGTIFISDSKDTYPAIEATWNMGVTETVNAGYESNAYINLDNVVNSSLEWSVTVAQKGNYYTAFRIANGSVNNRTMKIIVNDDTENYWTLPFETTGEWTTWAVKGIVLPLAAGVNKIKVVSQTDEGGPNFDYIKLNITDEPAAETYTPDQPGNIPSSENPVIYIAGDSTVQSYRESYAPMQGWGYYLVDYFNSNVTVANHSIAGRSSKLFYDNGRLDNILNQMKTGDYLLVQFAINDADYSKSERYAPVCNSVTSPADGSFEFYINKYVEGALAKGGTPVLVTTTIGLKSYSNGKFLNSYDNYCNAMKNIAAYYKIPCIDLNSLMVSHYNSIGYDAAKLYHMCGAVADSTDMTHFCEKGANVVAGIVANAIKQLGLPVSGYVK